ncbi:hypothetical protein FKM82_005101 [Ascaphus truei]
MRVSAAQGVRLLSVSWRGRGSWLALSQYVPACPPADPRHLEALKDFVSRSRSLFVMTGAGISTESGIPDYRSEGVGLYSRTERRPIQHAEFVRSGAARQRYWARNFVGWPQFSTHQPNVAHVALCNWERAGRLRGLVTQNVDALHTKAGNRNLIELHGCTHRVTCLGCSAVFGRSELQHRFTALNPSWREQAHGVAPDGDVFLTDEQVSSFRVPACDSCGGVLKPQVTFFGDTVSQDIVNSVYECLSLADAVLIVGSSLQVYSGYRFALSAKERQLPMAILNIGPTRADHLAVVKVNSRCGDVLPHLLSTDQSSGAVTF